MKRAANALGVLALVCAGSAVWAQPADYNYQYQGSQTWNVSGFATFQAVGLHNSLFGPGRGWMANFDITQVPPFAFPASNGGTIPHELKGDLDPALVQSWIDSPSTNYGYAIIPVNGRQGPLDPADPTMRPFGGNTQILIENSNGNGFFMSKSGLKITFTDGTVVDVGAAGTAIPATDPDNRISSSAFIYTPENGGPKPILYRYDLAAYAGKTVQSVQDTKGWFFSENGKVFIGYRLPKPYDPATVTWNNYVNVPNAFTGAGGSYFDIANWSSHVPNHRFAEADLGNVASRSITVDQALTLNKLTMNNGTTSISGTGSVTFSKGYVMTDRNIQSFDGVNYGVPTPQATFFGYDYPVVTSGFGSHTISNPVTIAHGTVFFMFPGTRVTLAGKVTGQSFDNGFGSVPQGVFAQNGGTLQITGGYDAGPIVVQNTSGSYTSFVDLVSGSAVVAGQSLSSMNAQLAAWWNGGARDGKGLGSSLSTPSATGRDAHASVALVSNDSGFGFPRYASFLGSSADATDLLLRYTYFGDTDLNGTLDGRDFNAVMSGLANGTGGWQNGDSNYDGVIDGSDVQRFLDAYQYVLGGGSPFGEGGSTPGAIPEPAALGLLAATLPLLGRRRRG